MMRYRYQLTPVILLAILLHGICLGGEAKKRVREHPDAVFLREACFTLPQGLFSKQDRKRAKALAGSKDKAFRAKAAALLSMYERLYEDDALAALAIAAEEILDRKQLAAWRKENDTKHAGALAGWKEQCTRAKAEKHPLPEKPAATIYTAFPAADQWTINNETILCAVEVIRAHMDLKAYRPAMAMLSAVGQTFDALPRVLSAECGGDLLKELQQYGKCMEFYHFALKSLDAMRRVSESGSEKRSLTKDEAFVKRRIEQSLAEAQRLWDIEKYGEGWVLYKEGETLRRSQKRYADALAKFDEMRQKFPKTVYSEVAVCMSVKCLLSLADLDAAQAVHNEIDAAKKELRDAEAQHAMAKRAKLSQRALAYFQNQIDAIQTRITSLASRPGGAKALAEAEKLATAFHNENPYGLYRGEVLTDLASFAFERSLDPDTAAARYMKAWAWLTDVEKADAALADFAVPDKAREVSAPPAEEEHFDRMGNYIRNIPDAGDIVNRTTCAWYLDDLREKTALALGFIAFADGKTDEANAWYNKALTLDKLTGLLDSKGEWNNVKRLTWGAKHGYLYAYPEELKLYKKRLRFAVLLADFYYCTERFSQAEALYRRLLSGDCGKLTPAQTDYPTYALGACRYWTKGRAEACKQYEAVLARKDKTYTEIRAAYTLGHLGQLLKDERVQALGETYLAALATSGKENEFAYRAIIQHARNLIAEGKQKDGLKLLKKMPKDADGYYALAERYIERETQTKTKR